jgi:superfamily II DNA or RNA helicase
LEIGYDVPEVGIEIILASTSNMNQIIQRIGRIVRKYEGKKRALIYVVHVSDTKDDEILELIRSAVENKALKGAKQKGATYDYHEDNDELRIKRAYNILESNAYEPLIVAEYECQQQHTIYKNKLFQIRSSKEKDKFYQVNADTKTCSCPDFKFNGPKCKHIIATELLSDHCI